MRVKIWGCRGSLPAPAPPTYIQTKIENAIEKYVAAGSPANIQEFVSSMELAARGGFGGHTACIQVTHEQTDLIIDAGSGLRRLGETLACGPAGMGRARIDMLFTHFHWDHLIGLPFFIPIFIPGNEIHVWAVQDNLEQSFRHIFQKPYFPVPFERLGADIRFHKLEPRQSRQFGKLLVTPYQLDHPDPCWGYRIEADGKTFSYCVDTECTRVSRTDLGPDLPLYQNVDLMIFDAQYSFLEATEKVDWGHASAPIGLDLALREGVKKILFVHHDPAASDEKIQSAIQQTAEYYKSSILPRAAKGAQVMEWAFAHEGMVIDL